MRITTITTILLFVTASLLGQEHDHPSALQPDSTWGSEFFEFPIGFAQEIAYEGIEEARFPKGWSDQESDEFWSYVFTWDINLGKVLNAKEAERDLKIYFDGLMKLNHENKNNTEVKNSTAVIFPVKSKDGIHRLKGKIRTLNAFHTQKAMTLNVTIEQHLYNENRKSLIVFRFSPRPFEDDIWNKLNKQKLKFSGIHHPEK